MDTNSQAKIESCPICEHSRQSYCFKSGSVSVARCAACGLLFANPGLPIAAQQECIEKHATANKFRGDDAQFYFKKLSRYRNQDGGSILMLTADDEIFTAAARQHFGNVTAIDVSGDILTALTNLVSAGRLFNVCMIIYTLEKTNDPLGILRHIGRLLKPDGVLLLAMPSLDSWMARILRGNWPEIRPEHNFYFNYTTIRNILYKASYCNVEITIEKRLSSLSSIERRLTFFQCQKLAFLLRLVNFFLPKDISARELNFPASGMVVLARPGLPPVRRKLSVVMPVYNECKTFSLVMAELCRKKIPGLDIEIIVVESNSTDGTRDEVLKYASHPCVKIVLQDRAIGKGAAVRAGFAKATGDFILIQDADLEYDLNDYEALLQPLMEHQQVFVIGSRHEGTAWKMREFKGAPAVATLYNMGHVLFLFLLNVLYHQNMRDPFSMYKVFYRDLIGNINFECNRFDFDFELVIKLIKKGCVPCEIPVNYRARSHQEGKKVSMLRDPFTWLRALVKYRFDKSELSDN